MIDSTMTMEEFVRFNAPCMPGASGNLWGVLEKIGKEIDEIEVLLSLAKYNQSENHS